MRDSMNNSNSCNFHVLNIVDHVVLGKAGCEGRSRDWVQGWIQHCRCIWDYFLECCRCHVEGRCNCWDIRGRNNWILPIRFDIGNKVFGIQEEEGRSRSHCRCIHQDILDNVLFGLNFIGGMWDRMKEPIGSEFYEFRKQILSIRFRRCMWEDCIVRGRCILW